jgi:hypothetical protein
MDRVRPPRFVRKAGGQVPPHVLEAMERRHPNVAILWDHQANRWALVQNCRGIQFFIRHLGDKRHFEPPTLFNTVNFLDRSHPSNFASRKAQDDLLSKIDENPGLTAAKKRSSDAIREGSSDLFNAINRRVLRPVRP